ncbi:aromatic acid exporter family protein [Oceanobacillus sp. CF4.6]|uniref:aromatic acid exporter family protein n=1 Tax=Oceanobacillus sp. CF4.6 TaxID=3373080 RepID=UPI003EE47806
MVGMGQRTLKTAIGAGLAIWIASLMNLGFATFAAIIVIMCIEKTKKKTLHTIQKKFFASILSMFLGGLIFELFGYNPFVFSIFIVLFVPILVKLHIQGGFITSMVVVLHIYTVKDVNGEIFLNEFYIIVIGMGIALIVNSFMPNFKKDIETHKKHIEQKFSIILYEFSAFLRDREREWDGKEILEAGEIINESKSVAIQDVENHLLRKQNKDYYYLEMRENQLERLQQMTQVVANVSSFEIHVEQKEMFANFLAYLSENVHAKDTTEISLEKLEECKAEIRVTELPTTRDEFEIRANLFYLIYEIENYLKIKKKLFAKKGIKDRSPTTLR